MAYMQAIFIMSLTTTVFGQRGSFAGTKPIGYPEMVTQSSHTDDDVLGNRFGEGDTSATTQKLPLEALGDRALIDRLSKLPVDQQPFWFVNWQALENHRRNPQTYPQRPNSFAQSILITGSANTNPEAANSNTSAANLGNRNGVADASEASQGTNSPVNSNSDHTDSLGNRFGQEQLGTQNSSSSHFHKDADAGWKQILQYYDPSYGTKNKSKEHDKKAKH